MVSDPSQICSGEYPDPVIFDLPYPDPVILTCQISIRYFSYRILIRIRMRYFSDRILIRIMIRILPLTIFYLEN